MDLREKDTAIILFCCMLFVLLVIFFLSERRKYTLNNYEITREGTHDTYELEVKTYKLVASSGGDEAAKQLMSSRILHIDRIALYMGVDRKGRMLVRTNAPQSGSLKEYSRTVEKPADLSTDFLPDGSCNLTFFDADLVKFRGQTIRKGEEWNYLRDLSLFDPRKEQPVKVKYTFLGKQQMGERNYGVIQFTVPAKRWLDEGGGSKTVKTVNEFTGHYWVCESTGKLEKIEYSFDVHGEQKASIHYDVDVKRLDTRMLSDYRLEALRRNYEFPKDVLAYRSGHRKQMPDFVIKGRGKDLEEKLRPAPKPAPRPVYTIQLWAYSAGHGSEAEQIKEKLRKKGYQAFIIHESGMHKVCAGRFKSQGPEIEKLFRLLKNVVPGAFKRTVPGAASS
ncbi:SPOR domain-containing protein [Planctomycetota bacterium]